MNISNIIGLVNFKQKNINDNINTNNISVPKINIQKQDEYCETNQYNNDKEYKQELLKSINKDKKDLNKLSCVMGKQEFEKTLIDNADFDWYYDDNDNITLIQQTNKSTGTKDIKSILDEAVNWKNNNNKKMVLCITDFQNVDACKEALQIIYDNPEKFKNIKIIFGVQTETNKGDLTEFGKFIYCINPYDKKFSNQNIKKLANTNKELEENLEHNFVIGIQQYYYSNNDNDVFRSMHLLGRMFFVSKGF